MNDFNPDGEIHTISEDYAYCGKVIREEVKLNNNESTISKTQNEFFNKYAEYLYKFEKEEVIKIIMDDLYSKMFHSENFQFVYRPPWMSSMLAQYATFILKFKRSKNDNLDNK